MKTWNLLLRSLLALTLLAISPPVTAQTSDASSSANAAYQQKDWATAARLYGALAAKSPENPRYAYRLGVALRATGHNEPALRSFQQAQTDGLPLSLVGFEMACAYASLGQTDKAFETLTAAVTQGFGQPDKLNTEPALQPLKTDPRFAELVAKATRNEKPCVYNAENRQFDFWVGEWNVVDAPSGITAGSSHIEKELGQCVIWENWTSANTNYAGKSYNIYNGDLKRWEQFWVDNAGGMIHFYGQLNNGVMDFYTDEMPQSDGTTLKRHLQFFNLGPDKVRQFSQGSTDSGKTWKVEYDFTYNRRK